MTTRKRKWLIRICIVLGVLILLTLLDQYLIYRGRQITLDYSTTRVTSPLCADGTVDYHRLLDELGAQNVAPRENAAIPLLEALGPGCLRPRLAKEILSKLGLENLPAEGHYFVPFTKWVEREKLGALDGAEDELRKCAMAPWKEDEHIRMSKWLEANKDAMALIAEAAWRPKYYLPISGKGFLMVEGGSTLMFDFNQAFEARAMRCLQAGRLAECVSDIKILRLLSYHLGNAPTMFLCATATTLRRESYRGMLRVMVSSDFDPDIARRWMADLEHEPELPDFAEAIDTTERYAVLDMITVAARIGPWKLKDYMERVTGQPRAAISEFCVVPINFDTVMREINGHYDRLVSALRLPNYQNRTVALRKWREGVEHTQSTSTGSFSRDFSRVYLKFHLDIELEDTSAEITRTTGKVLQTVGALMLFRAQYGHAPGNLQELVPVFMPEVPRDGFSEKPLLYRREANVVSVYSVGPDAKDDAGMGDDIRVKMRDVP
jgi:hypothetical protein